MTSTNIPVEGDREFVKRVRIVAAQHDTTMADLVRKALEKVYGSELSKAVIFAAQVDAKEHNSDAQRHA